MSKDEPETTGQDDWRDCRPQQPEGGCDASAAIDERRCRDQGLTAQLEYTKTYAEALENARDAYTKARSDYRDKRHEAAMTVQDLKHSIKHLFERIRCLIEQERVVRCLDEAFCEVEKQLDCCEGEPGCCVTPVDFDADPPSSYRKLVRRIERYQTEVDGAKACFDALVTEPDQLTARVAAVKADVDAILAALADDAAKVDLKKQYAGALVAGRKLARVWNGYADNAAFVDCLCLALTTWSAGVDAVSLLTGARAVSDCRRAAAQAWCENLTGAPVEEILAVYDRICGSDKPCRDSSDEPGASDQPDEPDEPGGDQDGDCGCGHHGHGHGHGNGHEHGHGNGHGHGSESGSGSKPTETVTPS